jgi:transposase
MNVTTYAIDIAKSVFQAHWVEPETGEIHRRKLQRAKVVEFFARREAGRVVMEACGGAHHWARVLHQMGHQVELLPPHKVKESVSGNKDDARDARAIWITATQKDVRRVPVKSVGQQGELFAHRVRSHWVSVRTATVNLLRSMLYEFGVVAPKGRRKVVEWLAQHRAQVEEQIPLALVRLLDQQLEVLRDLDQRIAVDEQMIAQAQQGNQTARELRKVPGIGLLGASALAATLGDGKAWKNSREFACCLGVVPGHTGTGGKVRMGKITKRGDAYLRTLLIHGSRNLVRAAKPPAWIAEMLKRRPFNVVATAVAHKLARIAWSIATHGGTFDPARAFGPRPQAAAA